VKTVAESSASVFTGNWQSMSTANRNRPVRCRVVMPPMNYGLAPTLSTLSFL
jgi:hypothetical protein